MVDVNKNTLSYLVNYKKTTLDKSKCFEVCAMASDKTLKYI